MPGVRKLLKVKTKLWPKVALSLSAAGVSQYSFFCAMNDTHCPQVKRALYLCKEGHLSIESAKSAAVAGKAKTAPRMIGGKAVGIAKALNPATGKGLVKTLAFCDSNWGKRTRKYLRSAAKLSTPAWEKIFAKAQPYVVIKG
jgi:hypothetical protein